MSYLNRYTRPAERMRGCQLADDFKSQNDVEENNGTVTGSPTFDNGMTLDGAADKVAYPTKNGVKSIVFEIKLDSNTEDILKLSSSHSIAASSGTLTATGLSSPTYYIEGSATQTIGTEWVRVAISTATAFNADDIQVGYVSSFGGFTIRNLKLFVEELEDLELEAYSNGTMWNYKNRARAFLPMNNAYHDATNNKALDVFGNYDATFGAGSAEPTKNTDDWGYSFDGSDDYMQIDKEAMEGMEEAGTIAFWVKADFENLGAADVRMFSTDHTNGSDSEFRNYNSETLNFYIGNGTSAVASASFLTGNGPKGEVWNLIYCRWLYDGSTETNVDTGHNGIFIDNDTLSGTPDMPDVAIELGRWGVQEFTGNIAYLRIFGDCLNNTQLKDLFLMDRRLFNYL